MSDEKNRDTSKDSPEEEKGAFTEEWAQGHDEGYAAGLAEGRATGSAPLDEANAEVARLTAVAIAAEAHERYDQPSSRAALQHALTAWKAGPCARPAGVTEASETAQRTVDEMLRCVTCAFCDEPFPAEELASHVRTAHVTAASPNASPDYSSAASCRHGIREPYPCQECAAFPPADGPSSGLAGYADTLRQAALLGDWRIVDAVRWEMEALAKSGDTKGSAR